MKYYTILSLLLLINVVNAQNKIDYQKINNLYYNMNDYDFKGFTADIKLAVMDQLKSAIKDEEQLNVLNNLELKLEYYGRDSINFYIENLVETDNKQFDLGVSQIITGTEKMVKGFFQTWTEITFSSVFDSTNDYEYEITDKLLRVSYNQDGLEITNYFNNMIDLDSTIYKDESSITKMHLLFEKTSFNKKILKTLNTIGDGFELKMEVIYKDFDKIKIPHIINSIMKLFNINQTSQIEFANIKLL